MRSRPTPSLSQAHCHAKLTTTLVQQQLPSDTGTGDHLKVLHLASETSLPRVVGCAVRKQGVVGCAGRNTRVAAGGPEKNTEVEHLKEFIQM